MANPSKARGTRTETLAVRWLLDHGFPDADRQPLRGRGDQGDLLVSRRPLIIAEVKSRRATISPMQVMRWWQQTADEASLAGARFGLLIVHRSGVPVANWDAIMPVSDWAMLACEGTPGLPQDDILLTGTLADWARVAKTWVDA